MMFYHYLLTRRKVSRGIIKLISFVEKRRWSTLNEGIEHLSMYDESIKKQVLSTRDMIMNLHYILNLSLVSDPPYSVIKKILEIEPDISASLVSMEDDFGNLPLQTACKLGLHTDIIILLLRYDKDRTTFRAIDPNNHRTVLHYATICALFRQSKKKVKQYQQKERTKKAPATRTTSNTSNIFHSTKVQGTRRPKKSKTAVAEGSECNMDLVPEIYFKNVFSVENFSPRSQNQEIYEKSVRLIKWLCNYAPQLVHFKDVYGVTALDIARLALFKARKIMDDSLSTSCHERRVHYKKVKYVYKILRKTSQIVKKRRVDFDDNRSDCAQCGVSTVWSLQLRDDDMLSKADSFSFIYQPGKEII